MTSAPIAIARKDDTDESGSDHDSGSSSDYDSDNNENGIRRGSQRAGGAPSGGAMGVTAGTMAYSLSDAQSVRRHQEMMSRASGRYGASEAGFVGAKSLPPPRAPFLSSSRQDFESRLLSLPPMSLPESAAVDVVDDTGRSVPSTYGSLRNSHLHHVFASRQKQARNCSVTLSSSVGDSPVAGGCSLPTYMERNRARVRQRLKQEALRQDDLYNDQMNDLENDDALYGHKNSSESDGDGRSQDLIVVDENDEMAMGDNNGSSLLGKSLTALGVMEFARTKQDQGQGENAASSLNENEMVGASQQLATKRAPIFGARRVTVERALDPKMEIGSATETKENAGSFDVEYDDFDPDAPSSPHNPDTFEAFDLDLDD